MIDILLVLTVLSFISPIIPTFGDTKKLSKETVDITEQYLEKKITEEEFLEKANDINYRVSKAIYLSDIANVCVYLGYFAVLPLFLNGQTLGKKIMKLRIKKIDDSNLTANALLIRTLMMYGLLTLIINLILLLLTNKGIYIQLSGYVSTIFSVITIATFFMILIRKDGRGIPDLLAKTIVTEQEKEV